MALKQFNTRGESPCCGKEGVALRYISHSRVSVTVVFHNYLTSVIHQFRLFPGQVCHPTACGSTLDSTPTHPVE
jgi:hypothetical protein